MTAAPAAATSAAASTAGAGSAGAVAAVRVLEAGAAAVGRGASESGAKQARRWDMFVASAEQASVNVHDVSVENNSNTTDSHTLRRAAGGECLVGHHCSLFIFSIAVRESFCDVLCLHFLTPVVQLFFLWFVRYARVFNA